MLLSMGAYADGWEIIAEDVEIEGLTYCLYEKNGYFFAILTEGTNQTNVVVPSTVTYNGQDFCVEELGERCFAYKPIASITLPNTVTTIRAYAFDHCQRLTEVNLPSSLGWLENNAFTFCNRLTHITLPYLVSTIGDNAFQRCDALTTVTINSYDGFSFGYNCFKDCDELTSIYVNSASKGSTVSDLNTMAFAGLNLKDITVYVRNGMRDEFLKANGWSQMADIIETDDMGEGNAYDINVDGFLYDFYGDGHYAALTGAKDAEIVSIPSTVMHEGAEYAVEFLGIEAFDKCSSIRVLKIGSSVKAIMQWCLLDLTNLTTVYCMAQTPPDIDDRNFGYYDDPSYYANKTLYVPEGTRDDYLACGDLWSDFPKIVEFTIEDGEIVEDPTENMTTSELRTALKEAWRLLEAHRNGDFNENGEVTVKDITDIVDKVLKK